MTTQLHERLVLLVEDRRECVDSRQKVLLQLGKLLRVALPQLLDRTLLARGRYANASRAALRRQLRAETAVVDPAQQLLALLCTLTKEALGAFSVGTVESLGGDRQPLILIFVLKLLVSGEVVIF